MSIPLTTVAAAPAEPGAFLDALAAPAPHAGVGHLYDGLLGSWKGEVVDHLPNGTDRRQSVEIHFADAIVQTGADDAEVLHRWVFDRIECDAFHWRGEHSADGGATWTCTTEFFVHRVREASPPAVTQIRWEWTDVIGLEALALTRSAGAIVAEGDVVGLLEGEPLRARYRVDHDPQWRFRRARSLAVPPRIGIEAALRAARWLATTTGSSTRPAPRYPEESCASFRT
jgi:hypothetical protein